MSENSTYVKPAKPAFKPILCIDFDGVLHSYVSGWQGADVCPDPPVPGAMEFLQRAVEKFRVAIFSSRSNQHMGIQAMCLWTMSQLMKSGMEQDEADHVFKLLEWPKEKPPALVTIDDRAVTFTGTWPSLDELAAFKPWNKP